MNPLQKTNTLWADLRSHSRAYLLTAVASFGGMLFGWDTGLIGGVLTMPQLQSSFGLNSKSPSFASLTGNIVSVLQAGCFFGAMSSFYLSDRVGRRMSLVIADVIFLVGSLLQTTSAMNTTSLGQLYAGRIIGGFGVGLISAVVPTYIGECVNKEIRGRCIGCMQLFNVTGICLAYFVNFGLTQHLKGPGPKIWRIAFALQMLPGALLLAGMVFKPESPRWVLKELEEIESDFNARERMPLLAQLRIVCSGKSNFYRFSLAIILMFWQQWTGTNSINYYSPSIFQSIGLAKQLAGLFATGIYGVVKIVFTALAPLFITEQVGRKWSLIIGGLGQAFAMPYLGINQAVNPVVEGAPLNGNSTFAIVCVYLFVVFYSFGWGPIPFVLSAECSPNQVRSLIMACVLMTQWLFNFIIARITPIMLASITYGTFLIFGVCCLAMSAYAFICVPETKNVPLESIYILFDGDIVKGAMRDIIPSFSRANQLQGVRNIDRERLNVTGHATCKATLGASGDDKKSSLTYVENV